MNGLAALSLCLLLGALPEGDPKKRVHDFAKVLPAETKTQLEALSLGVERDTTAQLAIVTVHSLDGKSIDEYATELFNKWGIGRGDVNNGVLLLNAPNEREVRIEVGRGLEPLLTDGVCGDILDEHVLPQFKNNGLLEEERVPAGLKAGAERIAELLRKYPDAARGVPGSAPKWIRSARTDATQSLWATGLMALPLIGLGIYAKRQRSYSKLTYFVMIAVVLAVVGTAIYLVLRTPRPTDWLWGLGGAGAGLGGAALFNVSRYQRYRPHMCKHCGTRQTLLDETSDDAKLTEVQQLEEKLGAVDYDVWYCPACLKSDTIKYLGDSKFSDCPKCKARTRRLEKQETVYPATTMTNGLMKMSYQCMSCHDESTETKVIPRITTSSSGSSASGGSGGGGSSFGGGSSGGGGASRSY